MERSRFFCDLNNYVAVGVIRVLHIWTPERTLSRMWHPSGAWEEYPSKEILFLAEKEWIQLVRVAHKEEKEWLAIRVYILPEDAGRIYQRGHIDFTRGAKKHLMGFVDRSRTAWDATYTASDRFDGYYQPTTEDESLFYIFNTLDSPPPAQGQIYEPYSKQAVRGVLDGKIPGLKRILYPYQCRSTAAMIQKEAAPARMADPRMRPYRGLTGQDFYFDQEDGRLFLQPNFYEDQRGGILAETMGYGKTLICIALILATRGHAPQIPAGRLAIEEPLRSQTASLLEMAAAASGRSGRPWKLYFHKLETQGYYHEKCTSLLCQNVGRYAEPLFVPRSGNRKKERPTEKVIKLCATTLIIVPPNLLGQWLGEIEKHTDEGALDVLSLDHSNKNIPHEDVLRNYDVVLITKPRFEHEYGDNDIHTGRRWKGEETFKSPLSELRWLRVIVDEGHNFASSGQRTNAMAMLDKMHIERRWVVSGTPSTSLIGVEVGMAAEENEDVTESPGRKAKRVLQSRQGIDSVMREQKDLEKLRLIVMNFLKLQPWANTRGDDHAAWNRYMGNKDAAKSGLRKSADLRSVLQNLIVRHRVQDVEDDLTLPPLYNRVVYLNPSFYDKLSINLFLAILASNAVTSERTDQDYMFHEKNRKQLETLISNLRQSSFHWVGMKEHDVSEAIRISKLYLETKCDNVFPEDGRLLKDAIAISERALTNPAWKAFSTLHEIGVYLKHFPEFAAESWTLDGRCTDPLLLGTVQARLAQTHVDERLGEIDPTEGISGAGIRAMSSARSRAATEDANAPKTKKADVTTVAVAEEPKLKDQTTGGRLRTKSRTSSSKSARHSLDPISPLASTSIVGFSSSKLSYLITRLLTISPTEKSIVFYSHNNVAFWLAEALELVGIRFLIYSNTLTVARRVTYLATFNQKDDFRVLLMDLKQASHGLHVAAASRVFIVEPIWQPGVESQAIKRAHRIGQTRPVYVETLVLRDTLEDRMLRRRKQMSNLELQNAEKSLLDDLTMNEIIKNESFIPFNDVEDEAQGQMAPLETPQQLFGRTRHVVREEEDPDEGLVLDAADEEGRKKGKKGKKRKIEIDGEEGSKTPSKKKKKKTATLAFVEGTQSGSGDGNGNGNGDGESSSALQSTPSGNGNGNGGSIFGGPLSFS